MKQHDGLAARGVGHELTSSLGAAATAGASGVTLAMASAWVAQAAGAEALSGHMLQHVILMNLAAPLIAFGLSASLQAASIRFSMTAAAVIQLVLIYGWHAPVAMAAAAAEPALQAAMLASLLGSAVVFWTAILTKTGSQRWQSIVALLITGKLFCLLGALFVFAPRTLYEAGHAHHGASTLDDQQLAGLIMVAACPLTYVAAAVIVAWRWLRDLDAEPAGAGAR